MRLKQIHITALLILLGLFTLTSPVYCQESKKEIRATRAYDSYAYLDAITKLETISKPSTAQLRMLGESYLKTGGSLEAEMIYADIITRSDAQPQDHLNYAKSLLSNEKHMEHIAAMQKYAALNAQDRRGERAVANPDYHNDLLVLREEYTIKNLAMNSVHDDFAAFYFEDKVGFATTKAKARLIKRVYSWNERAFLDLNLAELNENGEFESIESFPEQFNTDLHEAAGALSPNGQHFYFTRNNLINDKAEVDAEGVNNLQLYFITKTEAGWSDEKPVSFNSKDYSVGHPTISADGKTMYFASDMPGGFGGVDIWKASILDNGNLVNPNNAGETINTQGDEMFPFIDARSTIYFASNGHPGLGNLDIFRSTNGSIPENLGNPINGPRDDFAMVLNAERNAGFFSSNREEGKGNDDIYSFEVQRSIYLLNGLVVDNETGKALQNVTVEMIDKDGVTYTLTSNEYGEWNTDVDVEQRYTILATSETHKSADDTVDIDNPIQLAYNTVIRLNPMDSIDLAFASSKYLLNGLVVDSQTGEAIANATVIVTSELGLERRFVTDENGEWQTGVIIDDQVEMSISAHSFESNSDRELIDDPRQLIYNSVVGLTRNLNIIAENSSKDSISTANSNANNVAIDSLLAERADTNILDQTMEVGSYVLNGLVVDSKSGKTISFAQISINSEFGIQKEVITDENGEWRTYGAFGDIIDIDASANSYYDASDKKALDDSLQFVYNSVIGLLKYPDPLSESEAEDSSLSALTKGSDSASLSLNNGTESNQNELAQSTDEQNLDSDTNQAQNGSNQGLQVNNSGQNSTPIASDDIYTITGRIIDRMHSNPLNRVKLEFVNPKTNNVDFEYFTGSEGRFYDSLPDLHPNSLFAYEIRASKSGYISKSAPFDTLVGNEYGLIDLEDFLMKHFKLLKADPNIDLADLLEINPIYFDLDKSNIRPDAAIELDKIVEVMTQNPTLTIELGSHTDCRASTSYNQRLSDRRAKSSAQYVRERITNPERIDGKGYGETQLVNDCGCEGSVVSDCSEDQHQENRRTEFKITKAK